MRMGVSGDHEDIDTAMDRLSCPRRLRGVVRRLYRQRTTAGAPVMARQPAYTATAGPLSATLAYRSTWERRLAGALQRLGIAFGYETARLDYQDNLGRWHTYTPDFTLRSDIHVEVKGVAGASVEAALKMQRVLARHPVTLLLWDAPIIEMVEAMTDRREVLGLLSSTRFR